MKKPIMLIGLLVLSLSTMWGGVKPSNAGVCFVVNGDCGQRVTVKGCEDLGNLRDCVAEGMLPDDKSAKQCTSGGVVYTSDCLCDQKKYKFNTATLQYNATYRAGGDTCKDRTGTYCTQKLCRDEFKYIKSSCDYDIANGRHCLKEKVYREDGITGALICGTNKKAAGSVCRMLYGPNESESLYKGCDCDPSYYPYTKLNKRQYVLGGSSCTGITDGLTRYTDLLCPTTYPNTSCNGNMVPEKTLYEVTLLGAPTCYKCREKTCSEYGAKDGGYYADLSSCKSAATKTQNCVKVDSALTGTRTCYKRIERTCSVVGGITKAACVAKIDNTDVSSTYYCRKNTEFSDCYHFEIGGTCPVAPTCPTGSYASETECMKGYQSYQYQCYAETKNGSTCYNRFECNDQDYCEYDNEQYIDGGSGECRKSTEHNKTCYIYHGYVCEDFRTGTYFSDSSCGGNIPSGYSCVKVTDPQDLVEVNGLKNCYMKVKGSGAMATIVIDGQECYDERGECPARYSDSVTYRYNAMIVEIAGTNGYCINKNDKKTVCSVPSGEYTVSWRRDSKDCSEQLWGTTLDYNGSQIGTVLKGDTTQTHIINIKAGTTYTLKKHCRKV